MIVKKSSSISGLATIAIAESSIPYDFDAIRYDGKTIKTIDCYDYQENAFAVKGMVDLEGTDVQFLLKGKVVE